MRERVYIAGPYSNGDIEANVRNAILAAHELADLGFAPFVPHLSHYWDIIKKRPYQFWLDLDNQFLPFCNGLLRLPGKSNGSDKEVDLAKSLAIPVFYEIPAVDEYFRNSRTNQ